jgi:hypothetical protein
MSSKYWIKLYHEILDDPKVMTLRPELRWRFIEALLMAGTLDENGYLPDLKAYAWRVRDNVDIVETEFVELLDAGLLSRDDTRFFVTKFTERQAAVTGAERVARFRERKHKEEYYDTQELPSGNEHVTKRYTDTDIDIDIDIDKNNVPPYELMLETWKELFPSKPQPRIKTKSIRDKINTRWKSDDFRDRWMDALERAARSSTLHSESWFDFRFFVRNDENYQKCLDGWMDWKDKQQTNKSAQRVPEGV